MAAKQSAAEKQLRALSDEAIAEARLRYPEVPEEDIVVSWHGNECTVDLKHPIAGPLRFAWTPDDDMALAGIRELA